MKIDFNKNGNTLTVSLDGRLDTITAPEFDSFLNDNTAENENLVIDCDKLAYISSAGLRILLSWQKKKKNTMKLINVCELVMEVFEMTGFVDVLTIE